MLEGMTVATDKNGGTWFTYEHSRGEQLRWGGDVSLEYWKGKLGEKRIGSIEVFPTLCKNPSVEVATQEAERYFRSHYPHDTTSIDKIVCGRRTLLLHESHTITSYQRQSLPFSDGKRRPEYMCQSSYCSSGWEPLREFAISGYEWAFGWAFDEGEAPIVDLVERVEELPLEEPPPSRRMGWWRRALERFRK